MKAQMCEICRNHGSGNYVRFANYQPLPDGMAGHPQGLEWFCSVHLHDAQQLANFSSYEAVNRIKAFPNQNLYTNPQPYNQNSTNAGNSGGIFRGFSYIFQDSAWVKKVLIGSFVTAIPIVEAISDGYQIQTIKNIRAGNPRPLPEWDDVTGFFKQGIGLRIAIYAIYIPTLITSILAIILTFAGLASWFISNPDTVWWIRIFRGAGWVLIPLIDIIVLALVPIVLMIVPAMARRMADGESFIALFNPFPTLKLIFTNFGTYILSRVSVATMLILAGFISIILDLIPFIGVLLGWAVLSVARFWGRLMWAYYLAHMKRGKA